MLKTMEVPTFPYGDGLGVYGYVPVVSSSSQDIPSGKAEDSTMEPRLRRKQHTINNEIFYSPPHPRSSRVPYGSLPWSCRGLYKAPHLGMLKAGWFHANALHRMLCRCRLSQGP
jgi:hypothetical protein